MIVKKRIALVFMLSAVSGMYGLSLTQKYTIGRGKGALPVTVLEVGEKAVGIQGKRRYTVTRAEIATMLANITVGTGIFKVHYTEKSDIRELKWVSEVSNFSLMCAIKKVQPTPLGYAVLAGTVLAGIGFYAAATYHSSLSSMNNKKDPQ